MKAARRVVNPAIRWLARVLCRVDDAQLTRVPTCGPLIIVANHVNFLDVPMLFTHLLPRSVTGFAKVETWDNPILGALFTINGAIPIRRGEADVTAFRRGLEALQAGGILAVAPEGTRSGDGRLRRGKAGAVLLALRSGAPILPIAYYGGEKFWSNVKRLARTDFHIAVGPMFYLDPYGVPITRQVRQQMADEIMYQIAALLPPAYRGEYADLSRATVRYLRFLPESARQTPSAALAAAPSPGAV